ncbi:MAG TPA: 2-succinyl-5-enolpyruvyl-6-hydroxy-3-cyclohexene-1-carboxylic-acid synthase, partial [Cytophagaceae bacterium]
MQPIINIAEICAQKSVRSVILSPGSRCAPLTLAFVRHPDIITKTISDERSAAFIALGMALQTRQTVGLLCTSGTAGLNYSPAVAEAFCQQVPLIIFTADRPPEWIDQLDGQTIRQQNLFGRNVKASYQLPVDYNHPDAAWYIERILSEAINQAEEYPKGPVHINVPLREPLYPETIEFDEGVKIISTFPGKKTLSLDLQERLQTEVKSFKKILIVAGQNNPNPRLTEVIARIS